MKQIKFRAWDGGKFVVPDYIDRSGTAHWKENSIPETSKIIVEYTGLHDKNGKEIYEGDIVKFNVSFECKRGGHSYSSVNGDERTYKKIDYLPCEVVSHKDGGWAFKNNDHNVIKPWWVCHDDIGKEAEIIGNIFENSELLKEKYGEN